MTTRLIICNAHLLFQETLTYSLQSQYDLAIVGTASTTENAIRLIEQIHPDVILIDASARHQEGIDIMRHFSSSKCPQSFIVISSRDRTDLLMEAVEAGASGYLLKNSSLSTLYEAIEKVRAGHLHFEQSLASQVVVQRIKKTETTRTLTSREREVLRLVAEGFSTKEIGRKLSVSPKTIDSHRFNLMQKLGVHKVAGLVRLAVREGFVAS